MNKEQLEFVNRRVAHYLSKKEDLHDFVIMTNKILRKDPDVLKRQLPFIDYVELCRDLVSLRIAIDRIAGWSDTLDIMTNPEEYDYVMRKGMDQE